MSSPNEPYRFVSKMRYGIGHMAQRLVYSEEELLHSLSNSLRLREHEIAERNSLKSRFMALFLGEDKGDTIRIDGMRLMQFLELTEGEAPQGLVLAGFYDVDLAFFRPRLAKLLPPDMRREARNDPPTVVRR